MAGLLGLDSIKNDKTLTDVNTLLNTGNYIVSNTVANTPVTGWGILVVIGNGGDVLQLFATITTNRIYTRTIQDGASSWSEWNQL